MILCDVCNKPGGVQSFTLRMKGNGTEVILLDFDGCPTCLDKVKLIAKGILRPLACSQLLAACPSLTPDQLKQVEAYYISKEGRRTCV